MEPDDYRPDPPAGIGYADFRAARARFQARLAAQSEIARLERAFALALPDGLAEAGNDGGAPGATDHRGGARRPAAGPP